MSGCLSLSGDAICGKKNYKSGASSQTKKDGVDRLFTSLTGIATQPDEFIYYTISGIVAYGKVQLIRRYILHNNDIRE